MRELGRERVLREGVIGGLVAGLFFAASELLGAALAGLGPGVPWQLSASLLLGGSQVSAPIRFAQFFIGGAVHFGLAALFGLVFGAISAALGKRRRNSYGFMLTAGAFYGALLWVVNFQVVARLAFPWFLEITPASQFALHVLAYGVPLAYWVALRVRDVETPRVHRTRHAWQTPDGEEEIGRLRRDLAARKTRARRASPLAGRPLPEARAAEAGFPREGRDA
jgi:hypothetical protein